MKEQEYAKTTFEDVACGTGNVVLKRKGAWL